MSKFNPQDKSSGLPVAYKLAVTRFGVGSTVSGFLLPV